MSDTDSIGSNSNQNDTESIEKMDSAEKSNTIEENAETDIGKDACSIGRLLKNKALPLFLALWYVMDIGLQINQTITYHTMASNDNGSYSILALHQQNESENNNHCNVSSGYFNASLVIWILPSFLCFTLAIAYLYKYELSDSPISESKCFCFCLCCCCFPLILLVLCIIISIGTALTLIFFHLFVPLGTLVKSKWVIKEEYANYLRILERIAVGLPQLILNVIFISNNFKQLLEYDLFLGLPVPISIVSASFTVGSLMMGLINGDLFAAKKQISKLYWKHWQKFGGGRYIMPGQDRY